MMPSARGRRFPPPWTVEETDACFVVRDANGQALAYVSVSNRGCSLRRMWLNSPNWVPVKKLLIFWCSTAGGWG
jgi:hypothetical protein